MLEIVARSPRIGWTTSSHVSLVNVVAIISSTLILRGGVPSSTPPKALMSLRYTQSLGNHLLCCEQ